NVANPEHAVEDRAAGSPLVPRILDALNVTMLPRRQWLLGRSLLRRKLTVQVAAPGVGKSTLAIARAVAVVTGRPITGEPVHEQAKAWVYNCEDDREDLERHWNKPGEHEPARPPWIVFVGVISSIATSVWIAALTPSFQPGLTLEYSGTWLLIDAALIVGTLRGVRTLWWIKIFFLAGTWGLALTTAFIDPRAQTIGGTLLLTAALVCLLSPTARRFERRRVRLVLD
ncbi:MAG: AAA family ATPase, partial [Actinomycetota bacterium]